MNSEKEVVLWWLNRRGYFTLSSVDCGHNKTIDIVGIKLDSEKPQIVHFEIMVSVVGFDDNVGTVVKKRFEDSLVKKKLKALLKTHVGKDSEYDKAIVIGAKPKTDVKIFKQKFKDNNVRLILFEDILSDIIGNIQGVNYNNPIVRSLQLIKYLVLYNPQKMALLLDGLNSRDKNKFVRLFLDKQHDLLVKNFTEKDLIKVLQNTSLKKPERLANILEEHVFSKRSRGRFVNELLKQDSIKEIIAETVNGQTGLKDYY